MLVEVKPHLAATYDLLSPRQAMLATPYAIYATSVPWTGISGIPAGFADGIDNVANFSAGLGLTLVGSQLSVAFDGSGVATTAARSDHGHFGADWSGSAATPGLRVTNNGAGEGIQGRTVSNANEATGVRGEALGVTGQTVGVFGTSLASPLGTGVVGKGTATGGYFSSTALGGAGAYGVSTRGLGYGLIGITAASPFARVRGRNDEGATNLNGAGVEGTSKFGPGVFGAADATSMHAGVEGENRSAEHGRGVQGIGASTAS